MRAAPAAQPNPAAESGRAERWGQPNVYAASLVLIVILGAWLRLHDIGALPLNFDEGATLYFARLPLSDLWGVPARLETNPPLFYTVERWAVLLFGDGPAALRLAPTLAGVLCIPMGAVIARRIAGAGAGLAAALLIATSAALVASSQDARAYAMFTLAALIAIGAELRLLDHYRQPRAANGGAWLAYVIASIAALYLHNTAVLMVAALNLVAALVWLTRLGAQRRFALHWLAANAAIMVAYAFWLPVVAHQSINDMAHFWIAVPTPAGLLYAMMNIYAQPYIRFGQPAPDLIFLAAGLAGAVLYRSNHALLALAVVAVLGVPIASWLISQWLPIMNGKTLLWLAPVFLVLVALGCTHARRGALLLTALLAALQLAACRQYLATRFDEGFPEVASMLRDKALPGDIIILGTTDEEILLSYYGWPRDRLGVFAASGPAWFRTFDGRPIRDADLEQGRRVWILTRSAANLHRTLAQRLGGGMTRSFNSMFGHGLLRNQPIQTLELSLFTTKGD